MGPFSSIIQKLKTKFGSGDKDKAPPPPPAPAPGAAPGGATTDGPAAEPKPAVVGVGPGDVPVGGRGAGVLAGYLVAVAAVAIGLSLWLWPHLEAGCCQPEVVEIAAPTPAPKFPPPGTQPKLDAIDPASGPIAGGNTVRFHGSGFTEGAMTVRFGNDLAPAPKVEAESPRTLRVVPPAHAAGRVQVAVLNNGVASKELIVYTYREAQSVTLSSLRPASGPITGGTRITIRGGGFIEHPSVMFDGVAATVIKASPSALEATAPRHPAGPVNVEVRNQDGQSATLQAAFRYICPASYEANLLLAVLLAGTLGGTLHAMRSLFWHRGNRSLVRSWVLMYVLLPVIGGLMAVAFYLLFRGGLFNPEEPGSDLWIVGIALLVGMFTEQAGRKLELIAEAALTQRQRGANQAPPAEPAPVSGALTITALDPNMGRVEGEQLTTLSGTGFATGDVVSFDGKQAESRSTSPTQMVAKTPPHPPGWVGVTVTKPDGRSFTVPKGFLYTPVSPASGSKAGGTTVTIKGANFAGSPNVTLGGIAATNVTVKDGTTLTAVTPAAAKEGLVGLKVTVGGNEVLDVPEAFQYTS